MGTNLETGLDVNREFKDTVFSLLLNGDTESARLIANSFSGWCTSTGGRCLWNRPSNRRSWTV
ncbi:MAG: hypothetical protein FWC23_10660 [Chitinispirillia bacterium]|nr:hypothetical protein [Chitinispirillia bacterium]MCL2269628.1 hypothetical protein [Chitinispirillia bacterium]